MDEIRDKLKKILETGTPKEIFADVFLGDFYKIKPTESFQILLERWEKDYSALQSALEEIKELTVQRDVQWSSRKKAEQEVYNLKDERDTLKSEASRMSVVIRELVDAIYRYEIDIDETGDEKPYAHRAMMKRATDLLTTPAAPEKAETCPTCQGVIAHGGIDPLTGKKCPTCKGAGNPIAEGEKNYTNDGIYPACPDCGSNAWFDDEEKATCSKCGHVMVLL